GLHDQNRILELIASGGSLEQVCTALCSAVEQQLPGATCSILMFCPETGKLQLVAAPHLPEPYLDAIKDGIPVGRSETRRTMDPLRSECTEVLSQAGYPACWSRPILSDTGEVLGAFVAYYAQGARPRPDEESTLTSWLNLASVA